MFPFWAEHKFLSRCKKLGLAASPCSKTMPAVCKDGVFVKMVKDIAGYYMFLALAAQAGKGDRSVVAGLELLSLLENSRDVWCSPVFWDISGVETFLEYDCQEM